MMVLLILALAFLAGMLGCSQAGGGLSKHDSLPAAQTSANNVAIGVTGADAHVATAATQATSAQGEVRAAIPNTTEPATGHLQAADTELSTVQVELSAARADLKTAKEGSSTLSEALAASAKERAALVTERDNAIAQATEYKGRWDDSWFGGKFWRTFWTVIIATAIIVAIMIFLNLKTDLFVVPFRLIGRWIADMIGGTWKALVDVLKGVWAELAGLVKKSSPPVTFGNINIPGATNGTNGEEPHIPHFPDLSNLPTSARVITIPSVQGGMSGTAATNGGPPNP